MYPSRLETRTKESNMCASQRVYETLRRNESKWIDPSLIKWAQIRDPSLLLRKKYEAGTLSVHVGTRKMVIYAWPG